MRLNIFEYEYIRAELVEDSLHFGWTCQCGQDEIIPLMFVLFKHMFGLDAELKVFSWGFVCFLTLIGLDFIPGCFKIQVQHPFHQTNI